MHKILCFHRSLLTSVATLILLMFFCQIFNNNNNNNVSYSKQACGDGLPRKPSPQVFEFEILKNSFLRGDLKSLSYKFHQVNAQLKFL